MSGILVCIFHTRCSFQSQSCVLSLARLAMINLRFNRPLLPCKRLQGKHTQFYKQGGQIMITTHNKILINSPPKQVNNFSFQPIFAGTRAFVQVHWWEWGLGPKNFRASSSRQTMPTLLWWIRQLSSQVEIWRTIQAGSE